MSDYLQSRIIDNICGTCKHAEFDYNEKGYFVDGCRLGYPEGSYENHWGDIIDCPEHEEAEDESISM